jgi:hypothetical protein
LGSVTVVGVTSPVTSMLGVCALAAPVSTICGARNAHVPSSQSRGRRRPPFPGEGPLANTLPPQICRFTLRAN